MSTLSSYLKSEVAKYKDIDHILRKLEDDGEVQNVYDIFKNIFDNEFNFTLQELIKIQSAKQEAINVKRQCENNLSLFKNNMILIVEMVVEKALRATLSENKHKYEEIQDAQNEVNESNADAETVDPNSSQIHNQSTSSPTPNRRSEFKTPRSQKSATSRDRAVNLSFDTRGSSTNKNKTSDKKTNFSQLSTSKYDAPLSHVLHGQRDRESSFVKDEQNDRSMTQQISPRSMKQLYESMNQSYQSRNSAGGSNRSFVNSEFNHIRGSVRFSKSPRTRDNDSLSPGPGAYDMDRSTLSAIPSQRMSKAEKKCYFDVISKNDSPGPHLYPSKHFLSNRK